MLAILASVWSSRTRSSVAIGSHRRTARGEVTAGALLALYAAPFALAYVTLDAGLGALLLFGTVQLTMVGTSIWRGERPDRRQWAGLGIAFAGLLVLVFPGLSAPPPTTGVLLMIVAGVAWGLYSLLGRGSSDPIGDNARSFRIALMLLAVLLMFVRQLHVTSRGVILAVGSGAFASGLGYAIWYRTLPSLSRLTASVAQLAVPVLAAAGGVLLLGEKVTPRLLAAGALVIGGIALTGRPATRRA